MCGIVGKVKLAGDRVAETELTRMRNCLAHRGPDNRGLYLSPHQRVGLGHTRLAILDTTSAGHQPMPYKNRYWIVYNGELYNFPSLQHQLEAEGYTFKSQTDTEVLLALYDRYGTDCLSHCRGMFAFAIYDEKEDVIFCARDRVGQKPFKYFYDGKTFMFASELKAFITQKEYQPAVDPIAIHHYLTYQYVPAPRTGWQNIQKLPAGHYLLLDIKTKKLKTERYWQLNFSHKDTHSEPEWHARIRNKLDEATRLQMISDVPLGAFLSGGVDSSAIVALMSQQAKGRVKTFSIGFPEEAYNELSYARQVANLYHTDHTELIVNPETMDILPELVASFEEPYADSSAIPTYYLSKLARQQVTVALNGDGGDENFAGYPRHAFHKLALALAKLHLTKIPGLSEGAKLVNKYLDSTFTMRAARFFESLPDQAMRRYVTYLCYFTNAMKQDLYQPHFRRVVKTEDSYEILKNAIAHSQSTGLDQALAADIESYLPDDLLVKVDIASMAVSLEARSPFLDHEFMELAARLPASLKLKGLTNHKYILKQSLTDLLPSSILARPKMGFVVPIERWFRGDMNSYLRSLLLSPDTRLTQEMLDPAAVQSLFNRHAAATANLAPPLWALLTLELWLRHYFP